MYAEHSNHMTEKQYEALDRLHRRYNVYEWNPRDFWHTFDLPDGYVAGWVVKARQRLIYVGVSKDGEISS